MNADRLPPGWAQLDDTELAERIGGQLDRIRQESRGGTRAPHKPLLILFALARVSRGESRLVPFPSARPALEDLLAVYGRPTKTGQHAVHDPFWRLEHDGTFWVVPERSQILAGRVDRPSRRKDPMPVTDVNIGELTGDHTGFVAHGGFSAWLDGLLRDRPRVLVELTQRVLDAHFESSLHESILEAVEMHWVATAPTTARRKRDPGFREMILRIYEGRCAVCGYGGQLRRVPVGIEAAHIRWHSQEGPDDANNGLALCSLHHKALDLGAIGLSDDRRVLVSQHFIDRDGGGPTSLVRLAGQDLRPPISSSADLPASEHVRWHRQEVFKTPARAS